MNLIFSYSTHIGDYKGGRYTKDNKTDHVLELYKISMERAKNLGHGIKFYGCEYSLNFLKGYYEDSVSVEDVKFDITDDLKIYIHSKEPAGSITFDGDIILENKLQIDESADVVFETKEDFVPDSIWQQESIFKIIDIFKKYKVDEVFENFSFEPQYLCNVGVIRFRTEELRKLFVESYYELKEYYLKNIEPIEKLIPQKFDLIFIDSFHNAQHVKKIFYHYVNFLKKGGILLIDDINWLIYTKDKVKDNFNSEINNYET